MLYPQRHVAGTLRRALAILCFRIPGKSGGGPSGAKPSAAITINNRFIDSQKMHNRCGEPRQVLNARDGELSFSPNAAVIFAAHTTQDHFLSNKSFGSDLKK